jgi:gliding motility-associated-like protein
MNRFSKQYIMNNSSAYNSTVNVNAVSSINISNNKFMKLLLRSLLVVFLPLFGSTLLAQTACNSLTNDQFFVNAVDTNGVGPVTYTWSVTGGASITPLAGDTAALVNWTNASSGNQTVRVIASSACGNDTSNFIINVVPPVSLSGIASTTCSSNGLTYTVSATLNGSSPFTATGSGAPGTWAGNVWTSGPITAGTSYSVSFSDVNNCNTLPINGASPVCNICAGVTITLNITSTDPTNTSNNNGTATVTPSGGAAPYSYVWTNAGGTTIGTSQTVINLVPGIYDVEVTDNNGCSATQSVVINPFSCNAAILLSFTQTNVNCFGQNSGTATVTATGGASPYTYLWSTGTSGATVSGLAAGVYTVTVTDNNGCQASESIVITQPSSPVSITLFSTDLTGPGTNNGTATANPSGGTSPYTYAWTGPSGAAGSTQTISNLAVGTYCVTVTDALGCSTSGCVQVNAATCQNLALALQSSSSVTCFGGSNGAASVLASGGVGPFTYTWMPGSLNGPVRTGLSAGTYVVTVTDGTTSCTSTVLVTISQPAPLSAGVAVTNVGCFGDNNGSVDLTVSGGTGPYTFVWSNGSGSEDLNNLTAGTYSVVITDANSCTVNASGTVSQPSGALSVNITKTDATTSAGCNNGTALATVTGGTAPYTYSWSGGAGSNASASNLTGPGTYTVTVTDANGCELVQSVVMNCVNDCDAVVSINSITNVLCNGGNTGSATVGATSVAHPGGPFTFVWRNSLNQVVQTTSGTTSTLSAATAGVYVVAVTINGTTCQAVEQSVTINQPAVGISVSASTTSHQLTLGGTQGSVSSSATGGTAPYTYAWTGPSGYTASGANQSGLLPGTYCVIATDANGCVAPQACTVVNPFSCSTSPSITFNITNVTCNGLSNGIVQAIVNGGTLPYTYSWSNGGPAVPTRTGLAAGSYTLTVTDALGCSAQALATVTQPNPMSAGVAVTNVGCFGDNSGALNLTVVGGTAPYSFVWTNGQITEDLNNLTAGTYSVVITDANSCTVNASGTVSQPSGALSVNITKTDATTSAGCNNGTALATVTGGTAPYTYSWSGGAGSNASASNLTGPGTYTVTVTDANGCELVQSVVMNCVNDCDAVVSINSITNVLCNGGNTGSATVGATSVAHPGGPFTFVWRNSLNQVVQTTSGTTSTLSAATAGVYVVAVTINGTTCQAVEQSVTINQPAVGISVSASTTSHQLTLGGTQGSVSSSATGGTAPYTYAWTGPSGYTASGANQSGLLPGTYCVIATDANGCVAPQACTVVNPFSCSTSPSITFNITNVTCNGLSNGIVQAIVNGGTLPYTYSWSNGGPAVPTRTGLAAGSYTLTVTDALGCSAQALATVTQPNPMSAGVAVTNVGCFGDNSGALNLTVVGGTAPYSFVWTNGQITEDLNNLTAGTYSVVITDANSCTVNASGTVSQPSGALSVNITKTDATTSAGCNNGTALATVTGGTAPYTYSWSGGAGSNASASNLTGPGTYTVTVTDANGCELVQSVVMNCVNDCDAVVSINSITNVLCNGGNTGSATVGATSVAHPGGPFTFVWRNSLNQVVQTTSGTTSTLSAATAGVYVVAVTINGTTCQAVEQSVTINQPAVGISVSASTTSHQLTLGGTQGSVSSSATGGTAPYTYAWTGPSGYTASGANQSGLLPGTYCVIATDANGCVAPQACTVVNPFSCSTSPSITFNITNVTCNGLSNGIVQAIVNGGTLPYTYSWSNGGPAVPTRTGLAAGSYTLTVTDALGCSAQALATVTQPNPMSAGVAVTNVGCFGDNSGALNLTVVGGTAPYSFVWTNGQITEDLNNLTAGTYSVVITDANSCTVNASGTVSQPSGALSVNITKTDATTSAGCNNGTALATVTGGTAPYTYSWSGGAGSNASASNLTGPGTYTVTVTDANGCELVQSVVMNCVNTCDAVVSINSITNVLCNGGNNGSATVGATSAAQPGGPFTFVWRNSFNAVVQTTNGATTSTLNSATAGVYVVSVTIDGTTCQAVDQSVTISQPSVPVSVTATTLVNQLTLGGTEGVASANPSGGTPPYSYLWTNGATSQTASGLLPGNYCVVVTDANGCASLQACTQIVGINCNAPIVSFTSTNVSCFNGSNGSIVTTVTGGTQPFNYSWSAGSTPTLANQSGLTAGQYILTLTDANLCVYTYSVNITQPTPLSAGTTRVNASCAGNNDGSLNLTVAGGASPYSFSWDNSSVTEDISNLLAGTYCVTITDINLCTLTICDTVQDQAPVTIGSIVANGNPSCGLNNGSILISGVFPLTNYTLEYALNSVTQTINLSSNATGQLLLSNLGIGTYSNFSITNLSSGCPSQVSSTVIVLNNNPFPITANIFTNPTACNVCNGTITFQGLPAGVSFTLNYTSSNGAVAPVSLTTDSAGVWTLTGLCDGSYSAFNFVNPSCGTNSFAGPIALSDPNGPMPSGITSVNPSSCIVEDGSFTITGLNSGTYTVSYSFGASTITYPSSGVATVNASGSLTVSNLGDGTYSNIVVTNAFTMCASTPLGPITLTNTPFVISANVFTNPTACNVCDGSITFAGLPTNTVFNFTYTSSNGVTAPQSITTNAVGVWTLNGLCDGTYSAFNFANALCGTNTFAGPIVLMDPNGPVPSGITSINPSSCIVENGSFTIAGLNSGTYTVTYTFGAATVTYPSTGVATVNASGNLTVPNLGDGTYSNIVVTNAVTMCASAPLGPITLTNTPFVINANVFTNPSACGLCNGSISFGGLPVNTAFTFTYTSSNGATASQSITTNAAGVWTLSSLCAGSYSAFNFENVACGINSLAGPVVLVEPGAPTPTGIINPVNPTACNSSDGRFTISGLTPGQYTVQYEIIAGLNPGIYPFPISGLTTTVGPSGNLIVTGLDNGTYANIIVTNSIGCTSTPLGPITLNDPIVNLGDAGLNDTICLNTSTTLSIAPIQGNLTVTWRKINFSIISIQGPANFPNYNQVVTPLNNTCYIAEMFNNTTGCTELDTVCVFVSKAPDLALEPNCFDVNEDASVTLSIINDIYANDDMSDIYGAGNLNANLNITVLNNVQNGVLTINETTDAIVYTPYTNFNGTDTLFYQVCNADCAGALFCDNSYICFNVIPVNDPPVAIVDFNNTTVGNPTSGNVLTNDFDIDGDDLIATLISSPVGANGTISAIGPNGEYTYTPSGTEGTDVFVYQVCDNGSPVLCDTASIIINVIDYIVHPNTNNAPIANPDGLVALQGTPVVTNIMSNDFDPDADDVISVTSFTQPAVGTGTVSVSPTGVMTYNPPIGNPNFTGTVTFTYVICDNGNPSPVLCDTAVVEIVVLPNGDPNDNNPPTAVDDAIATSQDTPTTGDLSDNDYDVDGDDLTFTLMGGTTTNEGGTISNFNPITGTFTYTPAPGFEGDDQFLYYICDNGSPVLCDTATAYVTVIFDDQAPIAIDDINNGFINTPMVGNVSTNDTEPDGDPVVFTVLTQPTFGGTLNFNTLTGAYTYTPPFNFVGEDVFTYTICDDANPSLCDTAIVTLTVVDITTEEFENNPPLATNDNIATYGTNPVTSNLLSNDFDPDNDMIVLNTTPLSNPSSGSVVIAADGTYTYTPNPGFEGVDMFTYSICDDGVPSLCDTAVVVIEVFPSVNPGDNIPPFAVDDAYGTDNESVIIANVLDNDILPNDGDMHTVTLVSSVGPQDGTLVLSPNGTFVFTPGFDDQISTSFVYAVCDNGSPAACDTATAYILVWDANEPPLAVNDIENTLINTPVSGSVATNDSDADGDVLSFNQLGTIPASQGTLVINPNGSYTFTPANNFVGQVTATYYVCDNNTTNLLPNNACDTAQLVINVETFNVDLDGNNEPVANDDNVVVYGFEPVTSSLLSNDFDIDGDDIIVNTTPISGPTVGTVVINPDGTYTYTPQNDTVGTFTFEYQICDNGSPVLCDTATVSITVFEPIDSVMNLPPVAVDDYYTVNDAPGNVLTGTVAPNDLDPNADPLTFTLVTAPNAPNFVLNPNGTFTYSPINGTSDQLDQFTYIVCDNEGLCDLAVAYITIIDNVVGLDEAPIAVNDNFTTTLNAPISGSVVVNDLDPENETLTATLLQGPTNGQLNNNTVNAVGTFTYTPNPGFFGEDVFTYVICDQGPTVLCDTATVTITVVEPSDSITNLPPFAVDDAFAGGSNDTIPGNILTNDINPDGDDLVLDTLSQPNHGTITSFDPITGVFTYVPNDDYYGPDYFTYVLCDEGNPVYCDTATVHILIYNDNNPPVAINDINNTLIGNPVDGDVSTNDFDLNEGDALNFTLLSANGSNVTMNPDGTYTFVPVTTGEFTFTYYVCDDINPALCDTAIVTVIVDDFVADPLVNNDPVANNDNVITYGDTPVVVSAISNDFDPDAADVITVTGIVPGSVTPGITVVDNGDGTFTVTPDSDTVAQYSFDYILCDNGSPTLCDTASVVIDVLPSIEPGNNVPPIAIDDAFATGDNEPVTGVVATNDISPDMDPLTFALLDSTQDGTITSFNPTTGEFTYVPDPNYSGPDQFTYVVCDNGSPIACDTATAYITVYPNNEYPIAVNDVNATLVDVPVNGNVSTNDSDPDNDPVSFVNITQPINGSLTFNPDGTYTYTPDANFEGQDSFLYSICDNGTPALCDTALVVINVEGLNVNPFENNEPVATDDNLQSNGTDPIVVCVICNDFDVDGDDITVTEVINPDGYDVVLNPDGTVTVTPPVGVEDTTIVFEYVICDNGTPSLCDTATVTIDILPELNPGDNVPPFAVDDAYGIIYNNDIMGDVSSNDLLPNDGDVHTFTQLSNPVNGDVTSFNPTTGEFTYVPDNDYFGPDQFTYYVCDNGSPIACDTATVYLLLYDGNQEPLAVNDVNATIVNVPVTGNVSTNDSDPDNDPLTFVVLSNPTDGTVVLNPNGTYTYTPDPDFVGQDEFTYVVCDNASPALCDTAVVVINIEELSTDPSVNNEPVATDDNLQTIGTDPLDVCVLCNDFDVDGDDITVTQVINPDGYDVVLNPDGTITVTPPVSDADTTVIFQYVICDNGVPSLCDTATVTIDVLPELNPGDNVPPFAVDDAYGALTNEQILGDVSANDVLPADGDVHTFTQLSNPTNGTVTSFNPTTGEFTYVPNNDYFGPDQFTYYVCDNGSPVACDTATVYLLLYDANQPPLAINDVNHTFNDLPVSGDVSTNDSEPDNDPVIFTLLDGIDPMEGDLVFNPDGTYTYTPEPGFTGTVTFTYSICDQPANLCDTAVVTIDVDTYNPNVNNEPIAVDDNVVTYSDPVNPPSIPVCILCNDSEPDGDPVTTTILDGPDNGTFTSNPDGTYTYTPDPGFVGDDVITYVNCDDQGLCDTAIVTISVLPIAPGVNQAPFAVDDYYTTQQDDAITTENVTDNDINTDNDGLTVTLVSGPSNGTVTQNADGTFVYTPNTGFAGEDQYTYQLCDDGSPILCDNATVYITILPDPVIAVNDSAFIPADNQNPIVINVLGNDTFSTGTPSVVIISQPNEGTVVVNPDGTVTYTPFNQPANALDSFQYVLCSNTLCDTAWVVVNNGLVAGTQIIIPDGISPNGDGVNDVLIIDNLLDYYPKASIVIFNRWGDEVWNSYGPYNNNWGGFNFDSVNLPDGTYFYILNFNTEIRDPQQGFVAIYRNK